MTAQPFLFSDDPIQERFERFDRENPHVWLHFERFTLLAIEAGRSHYSADAVCHRIRWHLNIETQSADGFKINDHFTSRYARKFEQAHPEHAGFFRNRELRAE